MELHGSVNDKANTVALELLNVQAKTSYSRPLQSYGIRLLVDESLIKEEKPFQSSLREPPVQHEAGT